MSQVQQLPTSGIVKSRLGEIELKNGYPTEASVKKIYNDLDFQRACQAYLWALPLMAMHQGHAVLAVRDGSGGSDCRPASTPMRCCRSTTTWDGSGQSAVSR